MSELMLPEMKLVDPPGRGGWLVSSALVSLILHAGLLAVVFWSPLRSAMEAAPPQAIDVTLVPPPEVEPGAESPSEAPLAEASPTASAEPTGGAAAATTGSPAETQPAEPATAVLAPTLLPRPGNRAAERATGGLAGTSNEPVAALEADSGEADGGIDGSLSADPAIAALQLGDLRDADRFYLEAMLEDPGLARARETLQTLPADKRLSQTCNIEALAQIGYSGEGFAPDVVMTDAYAMSVVEGTRLSASGAIFRSQERWYGLAFECTLSDDLTQVTAFSFRLGADVTDAVLERMGQR